MLQQLKNEANLAYTENGAVTNAGSLSDCVDLFAAIGALRSAPEREIQKRFLRAYAEDPDIAMKILFFARDVSGGLGERRVFRICMEWLAKYHVESVEKNIRAIAEFGRWDDVVALLHTPCHTAAARVIAEQFEKDQAALLRGGEVSLLGKWLPSANASSRETVNTARQIARDILHLSERDYRKALTALRARIRIIENNLRQKDYTFDYAQQPSRAMFKYRKAFQRRDEKRYREYLNRVQRGEAQMHTGALYPYELVEAALKGDADAQTLNTAWDALPGYAAEENALAVVDTSGSMYWGQSGSRPAAVALSLGMYFAEHAKGAFHNHFITFSEHPQLLEIRGSSFCQRLEYLRSFNIIANTNIEAVFDLILDTAVKNSVPQEELPRRLYIISDMEFDSCAYGARISNFKNAKRKFAEAGYALPEIVFWNVASRNRQQPVTVNDRGAALVSGCTPRLFEMVMDGEFTPYTSMLRILRSERYAGIAA